VYIGEWQRHTARVPLTTSPNNLSDILGLGLHCITIIMLAPDPIHWNSIFHTFLYRPGDHSNMNRHQPAALNVTSPWWNQTFHTQSLWCHNARSHWPEVITMLQYNVGSYITACTKWRNAQFSYSLFRSRVSTYVYVGLRIYTPSALRQFEFPSSRKIRIRGNSKKIN